MASQQQIKSRIKSVKNTKQITKAMELVAASRMRRAQEMAGRTRRFSRLASELLTSLKKRVKLEKHELFVDRDVKSRLVVIVASDRGLAGAYNSNVLKLYLQELKKDSEAKIKSSAICVGRKSAALVSRLQEPEVIGIYNDLPDNITPNDIRPIIETSLDKFRDGLVDAVDVIYTHYYSSLRQEAVVRRLLPAGFDESGESKVLSEADFEPSVGAVLDNAVLRLVETQLMQSLLEAAASEHSMRMMAMKSASDNATELSEDLTLAYNNARQAAITQELAEISGGAAAIN